MSGSVKSYAARQIADILESTVECSGSIELYSFGPRSITDSVLDNLAKTTAPFINELLELSDGLEVPFEDINHKQTGNVLLRAWVGIDFGDISYHNWSIGPKVETEHDSPMTIFRANIHELISDLRGIQPIVPTVSYTVIHGKKTTVHLHPNLDTRNHIRSIGVFPRLDQAHRS